MEILAYYLAAVNIILCALMGIDKALAKTRSRRIPEKTLFALAIIGGGLGGTVGMYSFHHKTLHKAFAIGFPLLAVIQIAACAFLVIKFG